MRISPVIALLKAMRLALMHDRALIARLERGQQKWEPVLRPDRATKKDLEHDHVSMEIDHALRGAFIFDEAPRGACLPYITFTKMLTKDWSTNTGRGVEQWVHIECWSGQPGLQEALEIADLVTRALEDRPLVVEGWHAVCVRMMQGETSREQQGRLARMLLKMRILLEEKEIEYGSTMRERHAP